MITEADVRADERERCAKIAEDNATISTDVGEGDAWIALRIAKAIRTGAPPHG